MSAFTLVSPRVEDATVMVKGSSTDYSCELCAKPVIVSPDSMEAIACGLVSRIMCLRCVATMVTAQPETEPVPGQPEGDQT